MSLIRHRRRTFLLCKKTGMQTWAEMLVETGKAFVGPSAMTTQMREDSDFWSLPPLSLAILCRQTLLVITFEASWRWTWHSPNGQHHNQIDYILVRKRFLSGVNCARTGSFPGADIGSDHNLLMIFHLCLKRISKPKHTRLKFNLEKLEDPNVLETFQAMILIGRKFAPLTITMKTQTWIQWSPPSTQQRLKQPGSSLANVIRKIRGKKTGSLQVFLICETKGESWERKDLILQDLRNTWKWTTTSRGACKRQKKTG